MSKAINNLFRVLCLFLVLIMLCSCGMQKVAIEESPAYMTIPLKKFGKSELGMYSYFGESTYYLHENTKCDPVELANIKQNELAVWSPGNCSWNIVNTMGIDSDTTIIGIYDPLKSPLVDDDNNILINQTETSSALMVKILSYDHSKQYPLHIDIVEPGNQINGWVSFVSFFRLEFYAGYRMDIPIVLKDGSPLYNYTLDGIYKDFVHNFRDNYCRPHSLADDLSADEIAIWDFYTCRWWVVGENTTTDLIQVVDGTNYLHRDLDISSPNHITTTLTGPHFFRITGAKYIKDGSVWIKVESVVGQKISGYIDFISLEKTPMNYDWWTLPSVPDLQGNV